MAGQDIITVSLNSEVGKLEGVILHTPSNEIENMTIENAEKSLYSDILNKTVAQKEHSELSGVLKKVTKTFELTDLLEDILSDEDVKQKLLKEIVATENLSTSPSFDFLNNHNLAKQLIEGIEFEKNTLTSFLNQDRFHLKPLPNFFFMRDASMSVLDNVLIGKMANKVRDRESLIMKYIFNYNNKIKTKTIFPTISEPDFNKISIEGGDFLVASQNLFVIGTGVRTTSQGIDFIAKSFKNYSKEQKLTIIVQELPTKRESFIHLDMIFTFIDTNKAMVYAPAILKPSTLKTIKMTISNGKILEIKEEKNLLTALKSVKMDIEPLYCGGKKDLWHQEREQWHSGANFFALQPGKIIGYGRNVHTIEELNNNGFEVITAKEIIENKKQIDDYKKCVITINGSELSRGGGGCRCMTMPIRRKSL